MAAVTREIASVSFYYILILLIYQNLNFQEFTPFSQFLSCSYCPPSSSSLYPILFPFACFSPSFPSSFLACISSPPLFLPFQGFCSSPTLSSSISLRTLLQLLLSMRTWILFYLLLFHFTFTCSLCFPQIAFICFLVWSDLYQRYLSPFDVHSSSQAKLCKAD